MKNQSYILILATWFLGNLDIHFFTPALPKIAGFFAVKQNIAQLSISLFLLGKAISMILWGILSEYFGRKPIYIGGLFLFILSNFFAALSTSILILLIFRFLQGCAVGATILMGRAMINDTQDEQRATRSFACFFTLGGFFICFLPFLGGLLNSYWSWQTACIIVAAYALLLLPLSVCIKETKSPHIYRLNKYMLISVFRHPIFIGYLLISALMMAGESAFNTSASFILIQNSHWTFIQYGFAKTGMAVMHLVGTACCGLLVQYCSSRKLVACGVYIFAFSATLMFLFNIFFYALNLNFIIPMMIYYFGTGFIVASATSAVVRPFPKQMAFTLALTLFFQFNCSALFSFIAGALGIVDTQSFMYLLCFISLVSLIVLNKLKHFERLVSRYSSSTCSKLNL